LKLSADEGAGHGEVVDLAVLDECWRLDASAEQAVRLGRLEAALEAGQGGEGE
jgi:hypothetical protein